MRKPLTDIWGDGSDSKGETNCKNHPDRIGFVDLGVDNKENNRYPCYECYSEICAIRRDMIKPKGA